MGSSNKQGLDKVKPGQSKWCGNKGKIKNIREFRLTENGGLNLVYSRVVKKEKHPLHL